MLSYIEAAAIAAAPANAPVDDALRQLIADRVRDWSATDLLDLTALLVVEDGDTEQTILDAVGYSPFANTLEGKRFGESGFIPQFDWLQRVGGCWYELIQTISDDGFAIVIFVKEGAGTDAQLLNLFREFAGYPETEVGEAR